MVAGCRSLRAFPPGHSYSSKTGDFTQWYNPVWRNIKEVMQCNGDGFFEVCAFS